MSGSGEHIRIAEAVGAAREAIGTLQRAIEKQQEADAAHTEKVATLQVEVRMLREDMNRVDDAAKALGYRLDALDKASSGPAEAYHRPATVTAPSKAVDEEMAARAELWRKLATLATVAAGVLGAVATWLGLR